MLPWPGCAMDTRTLLPIALSFTASALAGCDGGDPGGAAEDGSGGIIVTESRGDSSGAATNPDTRGTSSNTSTTETATASATSGRASVSGGETSEGSTSITTTGAGESESSAGETGCVDGGTEVVDFSYIWIANSTQGTVSKIDTQSATEVGRYYIDDYEGVDISTCQGPSRTSVNLAGNVAVLDRGGGLTTVIANPNECPDLDASGSIETAVDETPLSWTADECVGWHVDIPHSGSGCDGPRTVQWTAPEALGDCQYAAPRVWVAFCNAEDDDVTVWLLDGADGSVVQETAIPAYDCNTYGPYGGAVDANNNLYFVDRSSGQSLYRVDYDCEQAEGTDCWTEFPQPDGEDAYGITIDASGRIWMAGSGNSLYAFDTAAETYTSYQAELDAFFATGPADANATNILRGLMADDEGVLWIASVGSFSGGSNPGMVRVDPSVEPLDIQWFGPDTLSGIQHAAGTSIDVDGFVWLVDTLGDQAFKIDPVAPETHVVVSGLQYPYTYSDMTGFALKQVLPQ